MNASTTTDYTSDKTSKQLPEDVRRLYLMDGSIIPVQRNKKPPKGFAWKPYQTQRPSESRLQAWQQKYDPPAWGMVTGRVSNRIALDFDGERGDAIYSQWFSHLAFNVTTPNGGHIWLRYDKRIGTVPDDSFTAFRGVGVKSDGGYVVFTGTTTSDKVDHGRPRERRVVSFEPYELEELPEEFLRLLIGNNRPRSGTLGASATASPTNGHAEFNHTAHKCGWNGRQVSAHASVRNSTLAGQARVLLRGGMPAEWVADNISFLNQHGFEKPLEAREVENVLRKAMDGYRDAPFKRKPMQMACRVQKAYGLDRSFIPLLAKIYESAYSESGRWQIKKAASVIGLDLDITDQSWVGKKLRHLAEVELLRKLGREDQINVYEVIIDEQIQSELCE